jgi:Spy/CpxP family protein refolding chaperone
LFAQEDFQSELFSADLVLKYRSEIGLSTTQVTNVKKIYDSKISEFNSLKWDLDAALVALNKQLASASVDEKTSMAQMEKVMYLEDQLKRIRLGMLIKIKNEINPSQQEQLKKLRKDSDINGLSDPDQ